MKITLQTTTLIHYRLHSVWSNILDAISPRTAEIIWRWGNLWYETSSLSSKVITLWSCRITLKIQPTFDRMKITLQTTTLIHYRLHSVWSNILDAISPRTAEIIWRWGNLWYETSSLSSKVITLWSCRITLKIQPTFDRMKITLQTTTLIHYR